MNPTYYIHAPADVDGSEGLLAIVIPAFRIEEEEGIKFGTPRTCPLQVGTMKRKAGHVIQTHSHKQAHITVPTTTECLLIQKGELVVSIYTSRKVLVERFRLMEGDIILLFSGGHGFEVTKDCEIVEVRQGPYPVDDKERWEM